MLNSAAFSPNDVPSLRIAGFGACMITGYPQESGGFFEVACRSIEKNLMRPVQSRLVSLGGFPAPRAERHLGKKVFEFKPHYVVLQFGATDAQCPIRARNSSTKYISKFDVDRASAVSQSRSSSVLRFLRWEMDQGQPYSVVSPLRWKIASIMGFIRKIEPITPLPAYVAAIEHMVNDCIAAKITPVVLSPFVFGSTYTMRNAILYTKALHELHQRVQGMLLIDCIQVLAAFPKSTILLNDGFHLSGEAHSQIGEAIGQAIVAHMENLDGDMELGVAATAEPGMS